MTKNEIIKIINNLISEVKQANEINIDVVISDIKCFLDKDEFIKNKYSEEVEKYNSLRNTKKFQQDIHKLLNQIATEHNIDIDAITPVLGPANKEYVETNLYFYNVDHYIYFLSENQQKFVNDINKPIPLLGRNLCIYEQVYETFENQNLNNINEYKFSKIKKMRIGLQWDLLQSYDYHFFDIESDLEQVRLLTQMKIASINMLVDLRNNVKKSFIEKSSENNNLKQNNINFSHQLLSFINSFDGKLRKFLIYVANNLETPKAIQANNIATALKVKSISSYLTELKNKNGNISGLKDLRQYLRQLQYNQNNTKLP